MRRRPTCHPELEHSGRGLCINCYQRAWTHGRLADYPRATRTRADFVEDFQMLRGQGYSRNQIAERLGMKRSAVDKAYSRARQAGELDAELPAGNRRHFRVVAS